METVLRAFKAWLPRSPCCWVWMTEGEENAENCMGGFLGGSLGSGMHQFRPHPFSAFLSRLKSPVESQSLRTQSHSHTF